MDSSSSSKQSRKELQGPRPTPLKVNKDSHKIKKPPVVPPPHPPPRQPVIIYAVSPKVIHVEPNNFMELVQRLTGNPTKLPSSSSTSMNALNDGQMSPAACYATIEKTKSPEGKKQQQVGDASGVEGMQMDSGNERYFPGILSPGPAALPPIPGNFFSPASDPNSVGFFSPGLYGNRINYAEGGFMPSPSIFVSAQMTYSPSMSMDIFNNFGEF